MKSLIIIVLWWIAFLALVFLSFRIPSQPFYESGAFLCVAGRCFVPTKSKAIHKAIVISFLISVFAAAMTTSLSKFAPLLCYISLFAFVILIIVSDVMTVLTKNRKSEPTDGVYKN